MTKEINVYQKKGVTFGRDWTKGSILINLLYLAWPVIMSHAFNAVGPIIDMIWVGKLGSASVAGVGVAGLLVTLLDQLKMGLDMGTRAMIARFIGANDTRGANHVALQGYVITISFAAIVGTLGALFSTQILRIVGLSPDVVAQGAPYLRIQFIGILTMGLVRQNEGTMTYSGDTINPMRIAIIYRLFHVALCPFLVFGWWFFPRLGTSGAAYTGIISACLGATLGLWVLLSGHTRLRLNFRNFRLDPNIIWRILKIGVPASITGIQSSLGQVVLTKFIVPFGVAATAAHSLIIQVTTFVNIFGAGLGTGTSILASHNLGAKQPKRAEKSGWVGVSLYTATMVVGSLIVWFFGKNVIAIFNKEPDVIEVGKVFLEIQIITYLVSGFSSVLQQCLNVFGDTLMVMLIVLFGTFAVQIPLAYFLSQSTVLGVYGVYWAIAIGTTMMASTYVIYFRLGKWQHKKI